MAKDGTMRGGARPGTGPKRKALADRISVGTAADALALPEPADIEGADVPPVRDFLTRNLSGDTAFRHGRPAA